MAETMAQLLLEHTQDHGLGAIDVDNTRWSWAQLVARATRVGAVASKILREQDPPHIGVLLPNGLDYLDWLSGAALIGATVVGINPTRRGEQLAADIRSVDCQVIVTDHHGAQLLEGLNLGRAKDRIVCVNDRAYGELLDEIDEHDAAHVHARAEAVVAQDLFLLLFTSGTTGTPKAVRCTQGRLATIAATAGANYGFVRDDKCYCPMPLFHGNAIMALWAPALWSGAAIAPVPKFSASGWLSDVQRTGATKFTYVGKAVAYILATAPTANDKSHDVAMGFGTEASLPHRLAFAERFGVRLIEGYGSSEGGINVIATPDTPFGALGPCPPGMDVVVVDPATFLECTPAVFDEHGKLLNAEAAIGELVNRSGAARFEGYYERPDAEGERLRSGWYWSGDLAYRDQAGFFHFAGRGGDWLRVDSENMAAGPIEAVLSRYGDFDSVLVYGVSSPFGGGEEVMAAVELREGATFCGGDFFSWLLDQSDLGTKWAPMFVAVVDQLPTTATGKLTKVSLKSAGLNTTHPLYWSGARRSEPYGLVMGEDRARFTAPAQS
jgi:fatty-acyl-CoA synthase